MPNSYQGNNSCAGCGTKWEADSRWKNLSANLVWVTVPLRGSLKLSHPCFRPMIAANFENAEPWRFEYRSCPISWGKGSQHALRESQGLHRGTFGPPRWWGCCQRQWKGCGGESHPWLGTFVEQGSSPFLVPRGKIWMFHGNRPCCWSKMNSTWGWSPCERYAMLKPRTFQTLCRTCPGRPADPAEKGMIMITSTTNWWWYTSWRYPSITIITLTCPLGTMVYDYPWYIREIPWTTMLLHFIT